MQCFQLWKDPDKSEAATKALKITAEELKELNLIDDVIKEPKMGAHRDKDAAAKAVGNYIIEKLNELEKIPLDEILRKRKEKILNTGVFEEL